MKVLFIGGTGNISSAVSKLSLSDDVELYHLNRGNKEKIPGIKSLKVDINNFEDAKALLKSHRWDVVVNWIAFKPDDIERDFQLFKGKTRQYIFISSASAYQKPPLNHIITESTPLKNPFWQYSRDKIACEDLLMKYYRDEDFPMTIVRPSHTYSTVIPITMGGWTEYTVADRLLKGKPVVVPGDGTSLWTLTHADDFALGFIGLMGNSHSIGEIFHITSDEVLSWNQIYHQLADALDTRANIIHISSKKICDFAQRFNYPLDCGSLLGDKSYSAIFDNSKIKRFVPGFVAKIPFSVGIRRTLKWFKENPDRQIINHNANRFFDQMAESWKNV